MKGILLTLITLISLGASAQVVTTDGNTSNSVAPCKPITLNFIDGTFETRVRTKFRINEDATYAYTHYFYEYKVVVDSSNVFWKILYESDLTPTKISFEDLKKAIFMKVVSDSSILNAEYIK